MFTVSLAWDTEYTSAKLQSRTVDESCTRHSEGASRLQRRIKCRPERLPVHNVLSRQCEDLNHRPGTQIPIMMMIIKIKQESCAHL